MTRLSTLLTSAVGLAVASGAVASAVSPNNGALAHSPRSVPLSQSGANVAAARKAPAPLHGRRAAVAAARKLVGDSRAELFSATAGLRSARRRDVPRHRLTALAHEVRSARRHHSQASGVMRQIADPQSAGTPGAARFARACAQAGVIDGICRPVPWREDHLVFDSVVISRLVHARWPQVHKIGGWRPEDAYPDHPAGRAVDIMIPMDGMEYDRRLGDEIARYFQRHAEQHGIFYILWRQRMWLAGNPPDAWSAMSDRGSPSANHMDHVHISVRGQEGRAFRQLVQRAA